MNSVSSQPQVKGCLEDKHMITGLRFWRYLSWASVYYNSNRYSKWSVIQICWIWHLNPDGKLLMMDCTTVTDRYQWGITRAEAKRSYLSMAGFSQHVSTHPDTQTWIYSAHMHTNTSMHTQSLSCLCQYSVQCSAVSEHWIEQQLIEMYSLCTAWKVGASILSSRLLLCVFSPLVNFNHPTSV